MNEQFELLDPLNAQSYLKGLASHSKKLGDDLFRLGRVALLTVVQPGLAYEATVQDNSPCKVELRYDRVSGWMGDCSRDGNGGCEHVYAAMRSLLVENSAAAVRKLSSGDALRASQGASSARKSGGEAIGLARRLIAANGRAPTAEENKFLRRVQNTYERVKQMGHITRWDFQELGLSLGGYSWDSLRIWPALPADEYEFWLYVASTAIANNVAIPEFMVPITDLAVIEQRLARWRRTQDIEKWTHTLSNHLPETGPPPLVSRGETDLRLAIEETEARLHWLRPGHEKFEQIKSSQLGQLMEEDNLGRVQFTTEGALLWQLLYPRFYLERSPLRYHDDESLIALGRVLRTPLLNSRVVNRAGTPLERPTQPLRWAVVPAATEDEDYKVRLEQQDGTPAPRTVCVVPGSPTLYVSTTAVYAGPLPQEHILDSAEETVIPAPALEAENGVHFLQALGVELPPRVQSRVKSFPMRVTILCRLQATWPGSDTEDCLIQVAAEAEDGFQQTWNGSGWQTKIKPSRKKKSSADESIIIHDRTVQSMVPQWLEPLNLRATYQGELVMRITRKFPEVFSTWLKSLPPEVKVQLDGDLASFNDPTVAGRVKLDVTEASIDWFDLRVILDVSDATLTPEEIKLLLNARGGFVRLKGKGWRRLQYDLTEDENERLARLGLSARELSAEPQRLHALQLADEAAKKFLPQQQIENIERRVSELKTRVAPNLPAGVIAEMRPYQLEGFHFLAYLSANRFGGILADDMGLGKTLQTLAWLLWLRLESAQEVGNKTIPPSLVVCPKSVMDNWRSEATRFTPGLQVKIWPASGLTQFKELLGEAHLHVINYNQLRLLGEGLIPVRWLAVILDEGQYIKNPSSQTAQIARALQAERRLVLSGTPIENRLLDLWSLMAFAMPGVLSSRAQFAKLFDAKGDPFARRRLSARVRPFLLRRTKAQVAKDLPDRIEEDLFCEIEGEQKTLYRAELKHAQQILLKINTQKELAKERFHFLTSLLRLRQICCHPKLVKPDSEALNAKTEALLEVLEPIMEEGHKVLVFSQFVELLGLLRPILEERQWPIFYLAGETENRGELVREFQSAQGAGIFLISLKAGGFGLNLTAASYVVLFDPWWNPAVENQAIDRTHRIGQVNKVMAYRLLIKDSIEEKIRELQKQKKFLAEDVLGEERFSQSLTLDDLRFLVSD